MRYLPLADRITVQESERHKVSPGGIVIPDVVQMNKHLAFGTVLDVGAGRINAEGKVVPLTVKPGDVVAYPRKLASHIPVIDEDGRERTVILLREAEVIAIVEGLPVATHVVGFDSRVLAMIPTSRGLPDSVYENRGLLEEAEANGIDTEHPADEHEPGWTP